MVAPVVAVIDAMAIIVPTKTELVPSVAELPTCQNTLHACAPLVNNITVELAVIKVEPI
jgi:hypothetical protein